LHEEEGGHRGVRIVFEFAGEQSENDPDWQKVREVLEAHGGGEVRPAARMLQGIVTAVVPEAEVDPVLGELRSVASVGRAEIDARRHTM
jgi:hypothetical protein